MLLFSRVFVIIVVIIIIVVVVVSSVVFSIHVSSNLE